LFELLNQTKLYMFSNYVNCVLGATMAMLFIFDLLTSSKE